MTSCCNYNITFLKGYNPLCQLVSHSVTNKLANDVGLSIQVIQAIHAVHAKKCQAMLLTELLTKLLISII